ncbi:MAG: DUF58 domain-containing protein [Deltaproteobacteria bacterium]|nr:DUF58 domain-containing protein [Deltaproteobacteria bacterium]
MAKTDSYVKGSLKRAKTEIEASMGDSFLSELERLFLISRQVVSGKIRAERKTRKRGTGIEFAEHREYVPGDDFRSIDWNLYGRLEKLFVRLYEEEEDLPVYTMFDVSNSMAEGTPSKMLHAFQVASALTYVVLAHLDRATMIPFSGPMELNPPGRGKGRMLKLFHIIRQSELGGITDLAGASRSFVYRRPRRGTVIIISDFLSTNGYEEAINLLRYHKYRVIIVQTLSPQDMKPQVKGDVELYDVETAQMKSVTITAGLLKKYQTELNSFIKGIQSFCQDRSIPFFFSSSDEKLEDIMLGLFRRGGFLK